MTWFSIICVDAITLSCIWRTITLFFSHIYLFVKNKIIKLRYENTFSFTMRGSTCVFLLAYQISIVDKKFCCKLAVIICFTTWNQLMDLNLLLGYFLSYQYPQIIAKHMREWIIKCWFFVLWLTSNIYWSLFNKFTTMFKSFLSTLS